MRNGSVGRRLFVWAALLDFCAIFVGSFRQEINERNWYGKYCRQATCGRDYLHYKLLVVGTTYIIPSLKAVTFEPSPKSREGVDMTE